MKILKFSASWCNPCKVLQAKIDGINTNVKIQSIDIDDEYDTAVKYQVRGVPTLIRVDEQGNEVARLVGVPKTNDELESWINVKA